MRAGLTLGDVMSSGRWADRSRRTDGTTEISGAAGKSMCRDDQTWLEAGAHSGCRHPKGFHRIVAAAPVENQLAPKNRWLVRQVKVFPS
jgi:hypothetical protein